MAEDEKDTRIAELEDEVARLQAQVDLGDDPSGQLGVVTPQLKAFEAESFRAEVQAWERDTGESYYAHTGDVIEGATPPGDVEAPADGGPQNAGA